MYQFLGISFFFHYNSWRNGKGVIKDVYILGQLVSSDYYGNFNGMIYWCIIKYIY